jgi:glycerophosphoryl diester phosphodiesterase
MLRIVIVFLFLASTKILAQEKLLPAGLSIAGHRGGYYFQYPESSLSLFEYIATGFGTDTIMVELDIRKSKNGTLYIMHDETINRTTNGSGKITDLDDEYLNNLFLKQEGGTLTNERIPTLADVLNFIKGKNINLMLDIKMPVHSEVYTLVTQKNLESRMLVLTFNMELTNKLSTQSTKISLSALIETEADWEQFKTMQLVNRKKVAYISAKTPLGLIQKIKAEGVKVMADVSEAQRNNNHPLQSRGYQNKVKDQKLDILISDYPLEARKDCGRK